MLGTLHVCSDIYNDFVRPLILRVLRMRLALGCCVILAQRRACVRGIWISRRFHHTEQVLLKERAGKWEERHLSWVMLSISMCQSWQKAETCNIEANTELFSRCGEDGSHWQIWSWIFWYKKTLICMKVLLYVSGWPDLSLWGLLRHSFPCIWSAITM